MWLLTRYRTIAKVTILSEARIVQLDKLCQHVVEQLSDDRRQVMDRLIGEFTPTETMKLIIALVAATSKRERQILRLMMADIEKMEVEKN